MLGLSKNLAFAPSSEHLLKALKDILCEMRIYASADPYECGRVIIDGLNRKRDVRITAAPYFLTIHNFVV